MLERRQSSNLSKYMKTTKERYIAPESEMFIVTVETNLLVSGGGKGTPVKFGNGDYPGDDLEFNDEGEF